MKDVLGIIVVCLLMSLAIATWKELASLSVGTASIRRAR